MTQSNTSEWHQQLLVHLDWLRSVVRSRLGEPQSVDDVLQDVVADALAVENPLTIEQPSSWLYRLAVRKSLLHRRFLGRRRRAHENLAAVSIDQNDLRSGPTPLETILGTERQSAVRTALHRLAGRDIEILTLKYVHGWDYETICKTLGLNYWKVVHRLRIARRNLKVELLQARKFGDEK